MKKYRIVDKQRFAGFIIVVLAVAIISTMFFTIDIKAAEEPIVITNSGLQEILEQYDLELITVKPGDTFWKIQSEKLPNEDTREMKFYAEFINEKSMSELQAWERIFVFTEKED